MSVVMVFIYYLLAYFFCLLSDHLPQACSAEYGSVILVSAFWVVVSPFLTSLHLSYNGHGVLHSL